MAQQNTDTLAVELVVEDQKATVKLDGFRQKVKLVNDDINKVGGDSKFAGKLTYDLDALSKRAESTRQKFEDITKVRLDGGQIGHLTQEIVRTSERARQLQSDIIGIRREIANPSRKSSIAFLTDELRAAEREADVLNRKLQTVAAATPAGGASPSASGARGDKIGRLRGFGAVFRAAGLNGGESEINAGLAVAEFAGIEAAGVAAFGAIAIAGAAVVKVTQNIREESERQLRVQEQIQAAINNEILSRKQAIKDLKEFRENESQDRQFSKTLGQASGTDGINELKARRETLEKLFSLNSKGELAEKNKNEILAIDARIYAIQQENQKKASDSFQQHWDAWKKSSEDAIDAEKKHAALLKQKNADIESATKKVEELGKRYRDTFDNLFVSTSKDNPFANIFSESDRAVDRLRENLRGLKPELVAVAEQIQRKADDNRLFSARLDNRLNVFDLQDQAAQFREFKEKLAPQIDDPNKFFSDFIEAGLKKIANGGSGGTRFNLTGDGKTTQGFSQNESNPFVRYNANIFTDKNGKQFTNGFSQSDARNDLFYAYDLTGDGKTTQGFHRRNRAFDDLTTSEKQNYISSLNKSDDKDLRFQDRLQKQIALAQGSGFLNPDQQAIVDRKLIALTSVDSSRLNERERDTAAQVREREAVRKTDEERAARDLQIQELAYQKTIAEELTRLRQIAEKEGTKGIENVIRLIDDRSDGKSELKKAPTAADVQRNADAAYTGGSFFGDYENR